MFCTVCYATVCNRDSQKHLSCGYLVSIETVIRAITSQINYLEIMQALLKHTVGEEPSAEIVVKMSECKNVLLSLQHICRHKLKLGHV